MRTISAAGLTKLSTRFATEPINILEVSWNDDGPISYADRDIDGTPIKGRILELSDLDNIVNVTGNNNSQEISVTLDDTDGSIKDILDNHDVHKRNVSVYQWFGGLDLTDKFLLFQGKITSPIVWNERDQTVKFNIVSQLEDKEIGFSAEEGQFPYLPREMVGKPWPMIFGTCLDVPALQVNKAVSGTTLCGVGIYSGEDLHNAVPLGANDCGLAMQLAQMSGQTLHLAEVQAAFASVNDAIEATKYRQMGNDVAEQMFSMIAQRSSQETCGGNVRAAKLTNNGLGCNPVRILGGEDFPQNSAMTLNINGGLFTGTMSGDEFHISMREHPDNDELAEEAFDDVTNSQCATPYPQSAWTFSTNVPPGTGSFTRSSNGSVITTDGFAICTSGTTSRPSSRQVAQHFWADAGSRVVVESDEPITYIVSIIPGTVLAVKAFKEFNGERRLVNVPSSLYTVQTTTYGTVTAVEVVTVKPLSTIVDQGWEDDLYVTFQSSVGPDIIDILKYIIDNYTDLDYDNTSFDYVQTKLLPFPANFPILDRKNTIDVLKEIAFQARCAIWLNNGTFFLKYLPEEPVSDSTITVSDIDHEAGVELELTPTEDIVTKMNVLWHLSWAAEEPNKIILRHNVKKYGTQEEEFDWYIFNQPDIVLKCATFWLIRMSKTWKRVRFRTHLHKLNLETFDTVTLSFPTRNYVATSDTKAIVEKANYDSADNMIDFEVLTPIEAGTMAPYVFFWPASVSPLLTFPTAPEIAAGFAGGDGVGKDATGNLPVGFTDSVGNLTGTVFVGGPNVVFRAQSDRGDRTPTDVGFVAQEIITSTVFAELDTSVNPRPDLTINYIDPIKPPPLLQIPEGPVVLDIRTTKVIDSDEPGVEAKLDSIVRKISNGDLVIDTAAKVGNGEQEGQFDFKFDEEGQKFGAGTAFLKDN